MATPHTITVNELRDALEQQQPITVLDIRTVEARAEWRIPGSIHFDAFEALKAHDPRALAGLNLAHDRPVVTVCNAGVTSLIAMEQLRERGYDVRSLIGGMKAWSLAWNSAEVDGPARIVQLRRTGKGCLSYLFGADEQAVVIDPSLEPDVYLDAAARHGWQIAAILETHVHADHLSRGRRLAAMTGAQLYLPETNRVHYPYEPVRDGTIINVGSLHITALHTPGHTMESTSYLTNGGALFTGDTLFLGGVGRPDLEAKTGEARERTHLLWSSLHRLAELPEETMVYPGHTGTPVPFGDPAVTAPLGELLRNLRSLQQDEASFVDSILSKIPPAPPNHGVIVAFNEAGEFPETDPTEFEAGANRCAVS